MTRIPEKIIAGLLVLFLIITVGYQVYLGVYGAVRTETVYDYTVSRAIAADGIAIRFETVLGDKPGGIENSIFEDGTRVSVGENIAEFYKNEQSNASLRRMRELESEIKMLQAAQDRSVNNFSTTDMLNRDIKEQLANLAKASDSRRFYAAGDIKKELKSLVNKKQVATGQVQNYNERIEALESEYSGLVSTDAESYTVITQAPVSGFFSRNVDGYEQALTPDTVKDFTVADYLSFIDAPTRTPPTDKIGKIVTTQNWMFAAACDKHNLDAIRPGQEVTLVFDAINQRVPATISDILQEKDEDRIVILLRCNQISGDLLALRHTSTVIAFNQYTGVRINMPDIRFLGDQRGVYILDKNTVRFKLIDPIYEEQNFILSRLIPPDVRDDAYVNLFDQVITRGIDLSDGKVIQ